MSRAELESWLRAHGGYGGEKENTRIIPESKDAAGRVISPSQRVVESVTYVASDGATITVETRQAPATGTMGPHLSETDAIYEAVGETPPDATKGPTPRTAQQTRADEAAAIAAENKNAQEVRDNNERSYNQQHPDEYGVALPETHQERAERIAKRKNDERQAEVSAQNIAASKAATEAANRRIDEDVKDRTLRASDSAAQRALTQQQIDEQKRQGEFTRNKPDFLSQADTKTPQISWYNPQSGQIEFAQNPNYDAVKAAAEERRAELASQIANRQITLEEAKQSYTQWFDTNVRVPLMQSQEARARAEERRQALEAEERRRQFAANYKLQKAQLGQEAGQAAMQAEISLLPYRSGPTWGEDISSAINSLAAGGRMDSNAAAGIHFSDSSFAFQRPDFKQIAKQAATAALSGLTDYRPSGEGFATADYSNVPQVNMAGMPAYQYQPTALPAPSSGIVPPE